MTHFKLITTLLAGAAAALSQTPPAAPVPPAPPQAVSPVSPRPAAAPAPSRLESPEAPMPPAAPAPPAPPMALIGPDEIITPAIQAQIDAAMDQVRNLHVNVDVDADAIRAEVEAARDKVRNFNFDFDSDAIRSQMEAAREMAYAKGLGRGFGIGTGNGFAFAPQVTPMPGRTIVRMSGSPERAYSNGQNALDGRRWEEASLYFNQVISNGTGRVDGALYWKAYALAKLGRRDESLAAIAELRKSHSNSRWLDDAKALEIEVNQAGGKPMSPDAETDEDLKLLIIEHGIQSDPERFFPALEKILKSSASPKLKQRALYVLAGSSSPRAQTLIEQIARGGGNPDLQVKAITYMTERRRGNTANGQVLAEIFAATNDLEVKRAVLHAMRSANDKDRLLAAAKSEKNNDLRNIAIDYFGGVPGNAELWQLYQNETTTEGKEQILSHMYNNGNPDKLLEVVRTEKEPKLRIIAVRVLGSYKTQPVLDGLVAAYANEQDQQVKNAIVDSVSNQRNGAAMIALAKAEKDQRLKLRLIERLTNMKNCKECSDYLMELLNK